MHQVRDSFFIAAIIFLIVTLLTAWIAILLLIYVPHLESSRLIGYLIDKYSYVGFKSLLMIGIVSMIISTADSCVNSASIIFTYDILIKTGLHWVLHVLLSYLHH